MLSVFRGRARREPRKPNRRFQRGVYLLPSLLTLGNLFCGWACIVYALRGDYATAAPFVAFAMVLDTFDGRIARLTNTTSEFGVEFDSLADIVSFGVAPALLVFSWGLQPLGRLGWAIGFLYITSAAMRLARYNIQGNEGDKRYFVGLPSPAAAGVLASTVYVYPQALLTAQEAIVALLVVIVPAGLMVSRIRFRSFSAFTPKRRHSYLTVIVIAGVMAAIAIHPQFVLIGMAYTYVLWGLFSASLGRLRRRPGPATAQPPADQGDEAARPSRTA